MITYKEAFENLYTKALIEYYGGDDYVPLLTEGFSKIIPEQVYDEFEEELTAHIYGLLVEETKAA